MSSEFTRMLCQIEPENLSFDELVGKGERSGYVHLCSKDLKIGGNTDMNKSAVRLYRKIIRELKDFNNMRRSLDLSKDFVIIITPINTHVKSKDVNIGKRCTTAVDSSTNGLKSGLVGSGGSFRKVFKSGQQKIQFNKIIRKYSSDNYQDYINHNFKDVQHLIETDIKPIEDVKFLKDSYKMEITSLFLINDIILNVTPNYFRKKIKENYKHLDKVLINYRIVSVIFKVKFSNGSYRCLGNQFGFKFNLNELNSWNFVKSPYIKILCEYFHGTYLPFSKGEINEKESLSTYFDYKFTTHNAPLNLDQFYTRYVGCLLDYMEEYSDQPVDCFVIIFTSLPNEIKHTTPVKNVNSIPFKRNISNIKDIKKAFKGSLLPLTLDENAYGKKYYSTSRTYIDSINKVKRVVTDLSPTKTRKDVFSLDLNEHIETYIDEKLGEDAFTRHNPKSKSSITIRKDKITRTSTFIKLPLIKHSPTKQSKNTFNKHFGSFDLETYYNSVTGKNEVYSIGFAYAGGNVLISTPYKKTYYLEPGQKSSDIVIDCINNMLNTKYHNAMFYTHNLGGYDAVFILKILADYNKEHGENYYKLKAVLRDNRILKLQVSIKKSKSVTNTIFLVDSLPLLPMSLASLAESFSTTYNKPLFPYSFVSEKTLYYVGNTPDIEYFNTNKKEVTLEEYMGIKSSN